MQHPDLWKLCQHFEAFSLEAIIWCVSDSSKLECCCRRLVNRSSSVGKGLDRILPMIRSRPVYEIDCGKSVCEDIEHMERTNGMENRTLPQIVAVATNQKD